MINRSTETMGVLTKGWRIGILAGTGTALKRTIPALRDSRVCCVSVVHGRSAERLREVARDAPDARLVTSEQEFAALASLYDIVYIASPPFLHLSHIVLAAQLGKPIICEKPLVSQPEDLDELVEIMSGHGVPFMMAHQVRHQGAVRHIASVLRSGELGKPVAASLQWCFQMSHEARNASWKLKPSLGGTSALVDCGVHCMDLAIELFGQPSWLAASGHSIRSTATMDTAVVLMSCGGTPVTIVASQAGHPGANDLNVTLSEGLIQAQGMLGEASLASVSYTQGTRRATRSFDAVNLYRSEVEDFCAALAAGESTGASLSTAVLTARNMFAAEESARIGEAVRFAEQATRGA